MSGDILLILLPVAWLAVGVALTGIWRAGRRQPEQTAILRFGGSIDESQVRAVLSAVAGMSQGTCLTFEAAGDAQGISHFVRGERGALEALRISLSGLLPDCHLETEAADATRDSFSHGQQLWFRSPNGQLLLRGDQSEQFAAGLLAVLADSLGRNERVRLRIRLRPHEVQRLRSQTAKRDDAKHFAQALRLTPADVTSSQQAALNKKYSARTLRVCTVVLVQASTDARARQILERISAQLRSRESALGRLSQRRLTKRQLERGANFLGRSSALSVDETVGFLAWPIGSPKIDGLRIGTAPLLAPPVGWPTRGRVMATSNAPRQRGRSIGQRTAAALTHTAVIGPTGSGKSVLALNLIVQDMRRGHGALVVDLKGDLVDDVLRRVPEMRLGDIVVFDPASEYPQPSVNLFAGGADPDLTADLLLGTFREIFGEASWGVRSEQYFRLGLLTLIHLPRPSLAMLPQLFGDQRLRGLALASAADPWLASAWQRFDALSNAEQTQHLAAPMAKLEQLLGRKQLRRVLAGGGGSLDFAQAIAQQKIVLVRLPQGQLGRPAARLLTGLLLWQFFAAVSARAGLPSQARRPFFAYVDEVAALGNLPLPLDHLFEQARGFGAGLTLLPQALSQLAPDVRQTLMANVGSVVSFRQQNLDEAKLVARLLPGITAEQLQQLEQFAVLMRLGDGVGASSHLMSGVTLPAPAPSQDAAKVRAETSHRYGSVAPSATDAELRIDVDAGANDAATGLPGQRRRWS